MRLDREARRVCEAVTARDGSNLYFVSRLFRERERYEAFIAMYAIMRVIDDLVDAVPDKAALTPAARAALHDELNGWERRIRAAYQGTPADLALDRGLAAAAQAFPVPLTHWLDFLSAMRFDVDTARFPDFAAFLGYCRGATVAPTAIFVYLICAEPAADGIYRCGHLDFALAGHELGIFAYLAHILRDVAPDLRAGGAGLVYLATADLRAHGLDEDDLRRFVASGRGDARWRNLVGELCARAQEFRVRGEQLARGEYARLPSDRALVFRLIVEVYILLLERIQADADAVLRPEPVVSASDRAALVRDAALAAGFPLSELPSAAVSPVRGVRSLITTALGGVRNLFRRGEIARG